MILFPAVDIKSGKCVRLRQGKAGESTVFFDDPLDAALHWKKLGAKFLHIVDLDGAFEGVPKNFSKVASICEQVGIPVQLGGGIREKKAALKYLQAGVERLIVGTMALENKEYFKEMRDQFPGRIGVSLDADQGRLKTKGWVEDSGALVSEILPTIRTLGASFIVYTDISRDGMQTGINFQAVDEVLEKTDLPVLAAGGVTDLKDIQKLYPLSKKGLQGVITGKAIYSGSLNFRKAHEWIESQDKTGS